MDTIDRKQAISQASPAGRRAWLLAGFSLALSAATFVILFILLTQGNGQELLGTHQLFLPLSTITYALVGGLVASRHPRNPIGWLFCLVGVLLGLTALSATYYLAYQLGAVSLPAVEISIWLNAWVYIPASLLPLTFILLLFPDGHLPSARWLPVAWSAGLGMFMYTVGTAFLPNADLGSTQVTNPFGIAAAKDLLELLVLSSVPFLIVGTFGSLAALIVRFRRSHGIEHEQLKWLAYGGTLVVLGISASGLLSVIWTDSTAVYEYSIIVIHISLSVVAVAAGIAILRYRLYNIDILINRTLVYVALSAGVVGIYMVIVGGIGALFQSSGNFALGLLATGLAALFVQPLRTRLQRSVNRLMYGERDDPYTVLSHLSQQLKTTLAPTSVLPNIAEAIAQTLKLPYVALALKQGNKLEIAAAYGPPSGAPLQLPLVYQAETVGQLYVAPRSPGESFTSAERRLLEDIALQAGVAAHAVRLTVDLQRARERLVAAREEERRRLRRDLHDGLGPQLASMTLTVGATRELLRHNTTAADLLLQELAGHMQDAITDIRRVVYALRPPTLDDLGLVPALREQVAYYNQAGLQITIDAPDNLPPLPAAVEVAAYRIILEALTNVVRHARAQTCTVRVMLDDALHIEVRDNGVGVPLDRKAGVGSVSMRERTAELGGTFQIDSAPGGGTSIRARLPLRPDNDQEETWTPSAS